MSYCSSFYSFTQGRASSWKNIYLLRRKIGIGEKMMRKDRNSARKIDIIWSIKPTDLEISISEVSGPPNQHKSYALFLMINSRLLRCWQGLLEKSLTDLKDYIQDACTRTPDDNENADLFIILIWHLQQHEQELRKENNDLDTMHLYQYHVD